MNVNKFKLKNGLTVLLDKDDSYPVISLQVWINAGSLDDADRLAGISHFVEHALFKGTKKRTLEDINRIVEGSGGEINAFTTFEYTVYHLTMASRFFKEGLDVISDIVLNPLFPKNEIESEKNVILEEIKEGDDTLGLSLSNKLFDLAYKTQAYRRPIIGFEDSVRRIEVKDLMAYYKKFYVPSNMILAISGNFETSQIRTLVEKYFRAKSSGKLNKRRFLPEKLKKAFQYGFLKKGKAENIFDIAFPIPSVFHKDSVSIDALSMILGEGENSRLNREIVARQSLAKDASIYNFSVLGQGLLIVRVSPLEKCFTKALEKTFSEIFNLKEALVDQKELKRVKATVVKELVFQEETVYGRARKMAYFEMLYGASDYEKQYLKALEDIKREDILRVAGQYLKPSQMTVVSLFPETELKIPQKSKINSIISKATKSKIKKNKSAMNIKSPFLKKVAIEETKLSNGITLLTKINTDSPLVSAVTIAPGGTRSETSEDNGISNLVANLIHKGTYKRKYEDIIHDLSMNGSHMDAFVGKNTFGVKIDSLQNTFDKSLNIYLDVLLNAEYSENYFESEKERTLDELRSIQDNYDTYAYLEFLKAMYSDHPYGFHSLGTKESLSLINRVTLKEKHKKILDPENLVISVMGSFDKDYVCQRFEDSLGRIKRQIANDFFPVSISAFKSPVEITKKIKSSNAYINFGFRATTLDNPDRFSLEIINAALTSFGGGILFSHLREKLGLAYSVFSVIFHGIEQGYLLIYVSCDPANVSKTIKEIKVKIKELENGLRSSELERLKNYLVGSYEIELQRNSAQALNAGLNRLYNLPVNFEEYSAGIMKVSKEQIIKSARKYLNLNKYVQIVLSP